MRMHRVNSILAAALAAIVQSSAVFSESCPDFACRAMMFFKTCEASALEPVREGTIGIVGKVIAVEDVPCGHSLFPYGGTLLSVEVGRASKAGFLGRIQIHVGYCTVWTGSTGDVIAAMVTEQSNLPAGVLALYSCG
jgi:hypothetical protein